MAERFYWSYGIAEYRLSATRFDLGKSVAAEADVSFISVCKTLFSLSGR